MDASEMASLLHRTRIPGEERAQTAAALGFSGGTPRPAVGVPSEAVTAQLDLQVRELTWGPEVRSGELRSHDLPTPDLAMRPLEANPRWVPDEMLADLSSRSLPVARSGYGGSTGQVAERLMTEPIGSDGAGSAAPDRSGGFEPARADGAGFAAPDRSGGFEPAMELQPPTPAGGLEVFPPLRDGFAPVVGRSGDIPGLLPSGSLTDDPFDHLEPLEMEPELPVDGAYAHFDSVSPDPAEPGLTPSPEGERGPNEALARIALEGPAVGGGLQPDHVKPTAVAPAYQETLDTPAVDPWGLWPSALGAVVGVLVVLWGFPEVGRPLLEPYAPEPVLAVLGYVDGFQTDAVRGVRAVDARAAPYRAAAGRSLLIVAGRARNETDDPIEALRAVVRVLDGGEEVAREEVPVGVTLRPRALYRIVDRDTLEAAWAAARAEAALGPLNPQSDRPFMAVFHEPVSAAGSPRVEVEFRTGTPGGVPPGDL